MRVICCVAHLIATVLAALISSPAQAEHILTADGESISGLGVTITNRQLTIPQSDGSPSKQRSIDDLVEYNQVVIRELGDLKTRYVRVEHLSPTATNLSLAEVMVFEGDKNVAREGKATQEGVDYGGLAELALDGNTDGNYNVAKSTTHSAYVVHPWWELDLQRDVPVRKVDLWNRTDDGLYTRLSGSVVILMDANRKPLWVHYIDKASSKRLSMKIPHKGIQFGREDIKQFERYAGVSAQAAQAMSEKESELELVVGGKFFGTITDWTPDTISIETRFGDQTRRLTVPPVMVREVWSHDVVTHKLTVPRTGEQPELDNVYAKSDSGDVKRVVGKILSLSGESLLFEIDGQTRKLSWAKVVGLVFRQSPPPATALSYEIVDFANGQHLAGHCLSLTPELFQMETIWKQTLEFPRSQLARFSIKNGRIQPLVERTPTHIAQVGFLDLVHPYRINQSFTGSPLQIGDEKYSEGLCTHSHTTLDYDIQGEFSRFRSEIGLQNGDGDQGHVIVRIRVDGVVKYEEPISGGQPAKEVSIDLVGAKSLQLEIDFGDGFDVADHLVWGSPMLLKASAPPLANPK